MKGRKAVKAKLEPSPTKFVFRSQKASHRAAPKQGVYEKRQKDTNDQNFGFYFLATISCCLHRVPPMNNDFLKNPFSIKIHLIVLRWLEFDLVYFIRPRK